MENLANSPIFALLQAASHAQDEQSRRSSEGGSPETESEFELNSRQGLESTFRRKRSDSSLTEGKQVKRARHEKLEKPSYRRSPAASISSGSYYAASIPAIKGGSSCHQCKSRRSFEDLTFCTSCLDNKKKTCRKKYCEHCLTKFYNEPHLSKRDKATWICPSCRRICCCAACRRKEMKQGASGISSRRKPPRDNTRTVPMDYDAVLDLEELRLVGIRNEALSGSAVNTSAQNSSDSRQNNNGRDKQSDCLAKNEILTSENGNAVVASPGLDIKNASSFVATVDDPPLRDTLAYMMAVTQFPSVQEMLRRVIAKGISDHEKIQLISVLLRRVHQKYAAMGTAVQTS